MPALRRSGARLSGVTKITPRAPLTVAEGGTSATTSAGALVNLQVPMGTIERVNASAGLTGGGDSGAIDFAIAAPLSIALGGTNALNANQARLNLGAASLANPQFTGTPTAPTAPNGSSTTQVATTQFVQNAISSLGSAATWVTISDVAPSAPSVGQLWWDSAGGNLYIWYNDGTSSQWVIANADGGAGQHLQALILALDARITALGG